LDRTFSRLALLGSPFVSARSLVITQGQMRCKPDVCLLVERVSNIVANLIYRFAALRHRSDKRLENVPHVWPNLDPYLPSAATNVVRKAR